MNSAIMKLILRILTCDNDFAVRIVVLNFYLYKAKAMY